MSSNATYYQWIDQSTSHKTLSSETECDNPAVTIQPKI